MQLDDAVHERHWAVLGQMHAALDDEGFASQLIPPGDELPVAALVVALGEDDEERPRGLTVSVMPFSRDEFSSTEFVQFYVPMPYPAPADMADLGRAVAVVNAAMAVGHFAVRDRDLFFRYMLVHPAGTDLDRDLVVELVTMLAFHQEHFSDYLEGVIDGEIAVQVLPQLIEESGP